MSEPIPLTLATMRKAFIDAISGYSEETWAAGWMTGIEDEIRQLGGPWIIWAYLCGGWPRRSDRPSWKGKVLVPREDIMDWEPLTDDDVEVGRRWIALCLIDEREMA